MFLQFAQRDGPGLDLSGLADSARRHFGAELEIHWESPAGACAHVIMTSAAYGRHGFRVTARPAREADYARLDAAEAANGAHGMASLARRCRWVWEVEPAPEASPAGSFYFGALLASLALGPWLPPDDSGLFGVRSARLLSEKLGRVRPG